MFLQILCVTTIRLEQYAFSKGPLMYPNTSSVAIELYDD